MKTLILSTILRALVPLFMAFAIYMFFRGHNNPGGGFIAGLIASIPFMLHTMVFGCEMTKKMFRIKPRLIAGMGLLIAFLSGIFGMFNSKPFLSPLWVEDKLPIIGKLGTPIFFDAGVFFVVFGMVLQITYLLTEE